MKDTTDPSVFQTADSCILFLVTVLCSDRVTQMTKAYNDIEAVTRLLEEVSSSCCFFNEWSG